MNILKKSFHILGLLCCAFILQNCNPIDQDAALPLSVGWTSCLSKDGVISLGWTSEGGRSGHSYLLLRSDSGNDWLPEDGEVYSDGDAAVPGLIYSGTDQIYTDSAVNTGGVYYYTLFAADGDLKYSAPADITLSPGIDGISAVEPPLLKHIKQISYYIELAWQDCGEGAAGFIIAKSEAPIDWNPEHGRTYAAGDPAGTAEILWTGGTCSYTDTDAVNGREYYYKIFAYNRDFLYSSGLHGRLLFDSADGASVSRVPRIENYIIYYGELTSEAINTAKRYDLAIIHPNNAPITREQVRQIQRGQDASDPSDDVLVVAYVAVGEDLRTTKFFPYDPDNPEKEPDYAAMLADARFVRNAIGPRVDPRGPTPDGGTLEYHYSIGTESPAGTSFASYYLDDNNLDGMPDYNKYWGGAFVNAGDPLWFQEVDRMRRSDDGVCGLQELLTTTAGLGLGVDGVFMDALDTFAPNSWTDGSSPVQTEFEWTAPGFTDFLMRVKEKYPDKIVIQNRALYFFRPGSVQQYLKFTTRQYIDFLFFESFRLNSDDQEYINERDFRDNLYNYAPPILAEASRADGFQVLSLGYVEGPSTSLKDALNSGTDNQMLIDDMTIAEGLGFRHYLSSISVDNLNTYVLDRQAPTDTAAPVWSSVYNKNGGQTPPGEPDPHYGLQKADTPGAGCIRVYWDIVLDKNPVDYYLYYDTVPLDFDNNPGLDGIRRIKLRPQMPDNYRDRLPPMTDGIYPFFDEVAGFPPGTYHLCIRAVDRSAGRNMDRNQSTLYQTVN